MLWYIIIFLSKVIENTIATLRLIVVANGKKLLGAILQGVVAIIWICVTGVVVNDILKDPFKIVAFSLGALVGSYLGSIIEEKIALGNKLLTIIINKEYEDKIIEKIKNNNLKVTITNGNDLEKEKIIIFILLPRKKINSITKIIKELDNKALIISEDAFNIYNGHLDNNKTYKKYL